MNIGSNVRISYKANLDKSINPKGIFIGKNTWILANAMVLAHDHCRSLKADTIIGENCIIGVNSIILPGVKIGDHVIVGAGSIVTKDINSNSIVVGNPAKVVKTNIMVSDKGKLIQE
ncbi:acyltransferase [Myroides sp. LJL110]